MEAVDVGKGVAAATACLSCGGDVQDIVSLGRLPLANAYPLLADTRVEARHPLDLALCASCGLVQLTHIVPRAELFSEYLYFSSYSRSMLRHAEALVAELIEQRGLGTSSLAMEIASNDGYLLQYFKRAGIDVLGIEPATNIAHVAVQERGIPTLNVFFTDETASALRREGRLADVIIALNVLAHVDDLNGFIRGIATVLKDDGVAVVEVPYVREMVERTEFDTIYHEHLCYFSVHAAAALVSRHGLVLKRVDRVPIHGGSLRLFIGRGPAHGPSADALLESEAALGLAQPHYFDEFRRSIEGVKDSLTATLAELRRSGASIAAYGAAAKGTVLLNYCGLGADTVDFVADRSPHKQGRRMPGCGIPILDSAALAERRPDYVLLLVWNLKDEILAQEAAYRAAGGRFIVPLPTVQIV